MQCALIVDRSQQNWGVRQMNLIVWARLSKSIDLLILGVSPSLVACAHHPFTFGPAAPLAKSAVIVVQPRGTDPIDVKSQLERLLIQHAYDVNADTSIHRADLSKQPTYSLTFDYTLSLASGKVVGFQSLSIVVVESNTNRLVAAKVPEQRELVGKAASRVLTDLIAELLSAER